ncbi:MAG: hypothetical protein HQL69_19600 [Magnetococcales bacterium]|nr:hypothetical protein [Magnetococcales bacterium]
MKKLIIILFFATLLYTNGARADCEWDGLTYDTGTTVGPITCQDNGTWG